MTSPSTGPPAQRGLIPLGAATALFPRLPNGRRVAAQTVWRWITHGHAGVKLRAVKTPAGLRTSRAAVQRFLRAAAPSYPVRGRAPR